MPNRRDFFKTVSGGAAGLFVTGRGLAAASASAFQATRAGQREVSIAGKRIKVVDVHCHCVVPVTEIVKGTPLATSGGGGGNQTLGPQRLQIMDQQGVDVQALTINGYWWYAADRDLARKIVQVQNEGLAKWVGATRIDSWRWRPSRCSIRTWRPSSSNMASNSWAFAASRLAVMSTARTCRCRSSIRSGPRPPSSASSCSCIRAARTTSSARARLRGRGDLGNIIGNPLETTYFFTRLIFDGTLDKFPGLKICGAHAGGYLPSYLGRTDVACDVRQNANCANKKHPREYFKRELLVDTMVFSEEGLRHLVAEVGVGQVLYGTDVPFNWPVTVDLILNASFLSNADKEAILSGNAMKLLRIAS